jgi:tRNA pseudouridine38-40 synthase
MFFRYFIQLSFKGTRFHGWQSQPNADTIQERVNKALSTILHEEILTTGAGRTDTGVHARYFIAHFDSEQSDLHLNSNYIYRINQLLPPDIALQKIIRMHGKAHARFDAISRTYEYYISRVKDPFLKEYSYFFNRDMDDLKMNEASKILFEFTDFTSFSKLHTDTFTNNCRIMEAVWTRTDSGYKFTIKADRFLRNMVRAIVGTMIEVGRENFTPADFRKIIEQKNRNSAGFSVPAQGLFLTNIEYPYPLSQ